MTSQIIIRSSPMSLTSRRRQPLHSGTLSPATTPTPPRTEQKSSPNVGEFAGGTAAGCFIVVCCCPCVPVEFLVIAVYKVPASICRRILRKRRQKLIKKKKKGRTETVSDEGSSGAFVFHFPGYADELSDVDFKGFESVKVSIDGSAEAVELDEQMWEQFNTTGFWRSPSQRYT